MGKSGSFLCLSVANGTKMRKLFDYKPPMSISTTKEVFHNIIYSVEYHFAKLYRLNLIHCLDA